MKDIFFKMKHAYLIATNGNYDVLKTCLRMIDDERNDIYILFDKKNLPEDSVLADIKRNLEVSRIDIITSYIVNWGGYSQINAVLRLIETACKYGERYGYLHFLQGSDLPIKSQDDIHAFFDDIQGIEFININNRSTFGNYKCWYNHWFAQNRYYRKSKLIKGLNYVCAKTQEKMGIRKNTDINMYQGSALFSITQEFAEYVLSRENEIYKRFRYSLAADECFMQAIIMDSPYKDKLMRLNKDETSNARLIDWTLLRKKNSPHVWTIEDIDIIKAQPRDICFARKFISDVDFGIVKEIEFLYGKEGICF